MILKRDIATYYHFIQAKAGDEVKMIPDGDHGNVKIVEDKNGNRFPIHEDDILLEGGQIEDHIEIESIKVQSKATKKTIQKVTQTSLF
ncbi:hypothetical protein [Rhizosphaericola mali]|uniref:Uncharacterized protein n=1 Tax=Rhizosphaericola mali TaxID=2545455 RepID=A0A5P2G4Z0_9BACT|nr:hypothetical protein [Rhizosphaericola mali]QES88830.1 hypothetical protein E0W69_009250 [Rhizosphaericola mali]